MNKNQENKVAVSQGDKGNGALEIVMPRDEDRTVREWIMNEQWVKDKAKLDDEDWMKLTKKFPNGLDMAQGKIVSAMPGRGVHVRHQPELDCRVGPME
eukprot:7888399-Heterocapsa_arctica.AAC.1